MREIVSIRPMAVGDILEVMRIERECFRSPWHESAYRNELTNPASVYFVAQVGKRIVGFAGMWIIVDEGHITTIGVEEKYRGRHIGEKLLVALIDESLDRGAVRMTLEVRRSNHIALNLYAKYGFESVGIRPRYYTDNNEDALILWLDDMDASPFRSRLKRLKTFLESG